MAKKRPPPVHPLAAEIAADWERLTALATAEADERRQRAGDLAWVTRDRDIALAAIDAFVEVFIGMAGDPDRRAHNVALFRRNMLDAGAELMRKREADRG